MPFRLLDKIRPTLRSLRDALDPGHPAAPPVVQLRLYGGMPFERLDLTFTLHADDSVGISLLDRLQGRQASQSANPPRARLDVLRNAILQSGILNLEVAPPRIPPDSVVGELRIQAASATGEWVFLGDIGQAEAMRDLPSLQLVRAVGPMMALGKDVLQIDIVNPHLIADAAGPVYVAVIDQASPSRDIKGEHLVLYNLRPDRLSVGGFEIQNLLGHRYRIPDNTTIEPHGILRIWTGEGTDSTIDLYQRRKRAIWNNIGDAAVVLDPGGTEITRRTYTVQP